MYVCMYFKRGMYELQLQIVPFKSIFLINITHAHSWASTLEQGVGWYFGQQTHYFASVC